MILGGVRMTLVIREGMRMRMRMSVRIFSKSDEYRFGRFVASCSELVSLSGNVLEQYYFTGIYQLLGSIAGFYFESTF